MNVPELRGAATQIFRASLKAGEPAEAVPRHLAREGEHLLANGMPYELHSIDRIYLVGAGEARGAMTVAVEGILGDRIADGPTHAAGAIADRTTSLRARSLRLDSIRVLDDNDSQCLFQHLDDLVVTGPTNTNAMDLRLILVG